MHKFLHSDKLLLLIIALVLINNFEHSAVVYYDWVSRHTFPYVWLNWLQAGLVVAVIDLAVLAMAANQRVKDVLIYTGLILLTNLLYNNGLSLYQGQEALNMRLAQVLFALMGTYSIWSFSELYLHKLASKQQVSEEEQKRAAEQQRLSKELAKVSDELRIAEQNEEVLSAELRQQADEVRKVSAQLERYRAAERQRQLEEAQDLQQRTCTCGYEAQSINALNAHKRSCSTWKEEKQGEALKVA